MPRSTERNAIEMELMREGPAIYRGATDRARGLVYGHLYYIRARELSTGRIRIDILDEGYVLKDKKITLESRGELNSKFQMVGKNISSWQIVTTEK